jgi:hypothetical protein
MAPFMILLRDIFGAYIEIFRSLNYPVWALAQEYIFYLFVDRKWVEDLSGDKRDLGVGCTEWNGDRQFVGRQNSVDISIDYWSRCGIGQIGQPI